MANSEEKLAQLQTRLENLAKYEAAFKREIADIRREIELLKSTPETGDDTGGKSAPPPRPFPRPSPPRPSAPAGGTGKGPEDQASQGPVPDAEYVRPDTVGKDSNLEKFVGTYLISIIGVLVTVTGVGIGAKYAIDNNLISPLMRIVLGYAAGLSLNAAAFYLKPKYERFSAVLLSGGMAVMYFITYFAYGYYGLVSQGTAFFLMVVFTAFTVIAAVFYNRQVIANIGLVGGYAIPFLLSEDTGRASVLFGYIAILNIGILAVSVKKYWRSLFYLSFAFTWLIFFAWFEESYKGDEHFGVALISIIIFYLTFYLCFLAYKLTHKNPLGIENVSLVLMNSFLFFVFGHAILDTPVWQRFIGLFTMANAAVHFAVAYFIHKNKIGDKNAFYLAAALVVVFVTIAVPVQANGHSITILWMAEAAFLFAVGRAKNVPLLEHLSYPLMFLASLSLLGNWQDGYERHFRSNIEPLKPVFNAEFVTSLFSAAAFGTIYCFNRLRGCKHHAGETIYEITRYLFPAVFLAILFNTFRIEISTYFRSLGMTTALRTGTSVSGSGSGFIFDEALQHLNHVWQLNYSMFFAAVMAYLNTEKIKNRVLGFVNVGLMVFFVTVFLVIGLYSIGRLREIYIAQEYASQFYRGFYLIGVRYISLALVAVSVYAGHRQLKSAEMKDRLPAGAVRAFELGICFTGLVLLSNELINWLEIYKVADPFRLGLSVFWGLYALAMIVFGISRKRKEIRVFAIALFGVTLVKLFLYDVSELATIPKTVLFLSIGLLMLVVSFLYNKYTKRLFGEDVPK